MPHIKDEIKTFKKKLISDKNFSNIFYNYIIRACIASIYQEEKDKKLVISHFTNLIIKLLYEKNIISKQNKPDFRKSFESYIEKHLKEETIEEYFFFMGSQFNLTFDEKEFRLKLDNINQAIINDLGEDFEYRAKSYITSTHETRKDALIERNKNRWNKIKSFYEILLAMIFIFLIATNTRQIKNGISIYIENEIAANVALGFCSLLSTLPFFYILSNLLETGELLDKLLQKNIDSFFKIEEFENDINEQPFSKKEAKKIPEKMVAIETNQAKNNNFDTSNLIFNEKTQENQKDINPTPKTKMKTRSSHSAFFHNFVPTLVRPEKTKYEWFLAFDNYTIRYQIETETKIARKGSKETPLREGSLIIALDVDCVEESDRKDVLDVFNMARYFPGAAVDKNCIHDLGDDIFSIKSKKTETRDVRILGTIVGTTANKQSKLVYFCQQVDHKKLKKIIKSKKEKERLKQELIEISLEKIVPNTTLSPK